MSFQPASVRDLVAIAFGFAGASGLASVFIVPLELWPKWSQDSQVYVAEGLGAGEKSRVLAQETARLKKLADEAVAGRSAAEKQLAELTAALKTSEENLAKTQKKLDEATKPKKRTNPPEPALPEQSADVWLSKNSAEILFGGLVVVTWMAADESSCQMRIEDAGGQRDVRLTTGTSAPITFQGYRARLVLRGIGTDSLSSGRTGTCNLTIAN